MNTIDSFQDFLDKTIVWASAQPDMVAVALVGSYARNAAREDSDIDLILLSSRPERYLEETGWIEHFGPALKHQIEDYGKVTSLRVWYAGGPEVEFGLTTPDWASLPLDDGTRRVIQDGMQVVFEREAYLSHFLLQQAGAITLYYLLVEALKQRASPEFAALNRTWFKNPDFQSYGLRASDHAEVTRQYRKDIKQLSLAGRLELARRLILSGFQEEANLSNWILSLSVNELTPDHFAYLDEHAACFHGWASTDDFAINVVQPLFWKYPDEILELLEKWNRSEMCWKRRLSVVVFTRKVGESGKFTGEALRLCENLIWDKDDLVQKGVGWALKDNLRSAKSRVLEYIKDLRRRGVPSTITLYAIRDLKAAERQSVLSVKKAIN